MKLKDVDALKDKLCEHCDAPFIRNCTVEECRDMLCSAMDAIDDTPTVDATLVTHGRWLHSFNEFYWNKWTCSECGFHKTTDTHVSLDFDYCPKCGTKMDKKEE